MNAHTIPGNRCAPIDLESIRVIIDSATSFEAALIAIFAEPSRRLSLIRMDDEGVSILLGLVHLANGSEVFFSQPEETISARYTLFNPAEGIQLLADTGKPVIDEEWVTRRDRTFRIRNHRGLEAIEMEVAPSCMSSVILSYALSRLGQVKISRDRWLDRGGGAHDSLKLELYHLGNEQRPGLAETIWVDWQKLVAYGQDKPYGQDKRYGRDKRNGEAKVARQAR